MIKKIFLFCAAVFSLSFFSCNKDKKPVKKDDKVNKKYLTMDNFYSFNKNKSNQNSEKEMKIQNKVVSLCHHYEIAYELSANI